MIYRRSQRTPRTKASYLAVFRSSVLNSSATSASSCKIKNLPTAEPAEKPLPPARFFPRRLLRRLFLPRFLGRFFCGLLWGLEGSEQLVAFVGDVGHKPKMSGRIPTASLGCSSRSSGREVEPQSPDNSSSIIPRRAAKPQSLDPPVLRALAALRAPFRLYPPPPSPCL